MTTEQDLLLLWLDLETTGLDYEQDFILEIACVITDWDLRLLGKGISFPINPGNGWHEQISGPVHEMHATSGLLQAIRSYGFVIEDAQELVCDFLDVSSTKRGGKKFMLAGSGVSRFDIRFLGRYMPHVVARLGTYRHLDISPIRSLLLGAGLERLLPPQANKDGRVHRSMDDVLDHIEEGRYYLDLFQKLEAET